MCEARGAIRHEAGGAIRHEGRTGDSSVLYGVTAGLLLGLVLSQGPTIEAGDAAQLDRIRRALAERPAITLPTARLEGPVFRVTVYGSRPKHSIWEGLFPVPSYIRPQMPISHYEFLQQVTPEELRAATLDPSGVPVVPVVGFLVTQIKAANRKRQEANAKDEVRKALEELLACRANPDRPGCS